MFPGVRGGALVGLRAPGPPASFVFDTSDAHLLATIPDIPSNKRIFTISLWLKSPGEGVAYGGRLINTSLDEDRRFSVRASSGDGFSLPGIHLESAEVSGEISGWFIGSTAFEKNTWYHIVACVDTTQETSNNRLKFYRNGKLLNVTGNYPTIDFEFLYFMRGNLIIANIGTFPTLPLRIAFIQIVEGLQLTANDFGTTDSGVWKHKKYVENYGTHGLYLPGTLGFTDVHRGLSFAGMNMNEQNNLDYVDLPPYVDY